MGSYGREDSNIRFVMWELEE